MIQKLYKENYIVFINGQILSKRSGKWLKKSKQKIGYEVVTINGATEYFHRVMAYCFLPNPFKKETVNHINGIKNDNRIENLEWATQKENNIHALNTGLRNDINENSVNCRLDSNEVENIRFRYLNYNITQKQLAFEFGVSQSLISRLVNGKRRKHAIRTNISFLKQERN